MPLEENNQPGWFKVVRYQDANMRSSSKYVWLHYNCPCGCGVVGQLPLVPRHTPHSNHVWEWDENDTRPTLWPSIRRTVECKFHGHLKSGRWSAEIDGPPLAPNVYGVP